MQSRDFCYWLQGFIELSKSETLDKDQFQTLKNHLDMVFEHEIDPSMGSKSHQDDLKKLHVGRPGVSNMNPGFNGRKLTC